MLRKGAKGHFKPVFPNKNMNRLWIPQGTFHQKIHKGKAQGQQRHKPGVFIGKRMADTKTCENDQGKTSKDQTSVTSKDS